MADQIRYFIFRRKSVQSLEFYEQLVALVMSYSFTDGGQEDRLRQTMMVPFADLLNHHSTHHAELRFSREHLELVSVRSLKPVLSWL